MDFTEIRRINLDWYQVENKYESGLHSVEFQHL